MLDASTAPAAGFSESCSVLGILKPVVPDHGFAPRPQPDRRRICREMYRRHVQRARHVSGVTIGTWQRRTGAKATDGECGNTRAKRPDPLLIKKSPVGNARSSTADGAWKCTTVADVGRPISTTSGRAKHRPVMTGKHSD